MKGRRANRAVCAGVSALTLLTLPAAPAAAQEVAAGGGFGEAVLCRGTPACHATLLVRLPAAPFPYDADPRRQEPPFFAGRDPESGEAFRVNAGRRFSAGRNYADGRVLVHIPPGFDAGRPARILVFFHGHLATVERDVVGRFDVPGQVTASGRNVVLVAPQLARDAVDSHPGKLVRQNGLADLLAEAEAVVARETGAPPGSLAGAPVILVGFSGGNVAVIASLERGGIGRRIAGVILLDALFGEMDRYAAWLAANGHKAFFVAIHGAATDLNTDMLMADLRDRQVRFAVRLPSGGLGEDANVFLRVDTPHLGIPVDGPPAVPIAEILRRLPRFERFTPQAPAG